MSRNERSCKNFFNKIKKFLNQKMYGKSMETRIKSFIILAWYYLQHLFNQFKKIQSFLFLLVCCTSLCHEVHHGTFLEWKFHVQDQPIPLKLYWSWRKMSIWANFDELQWKKYIMYAICSISSNNFSLSSLH